MYSGNNSSGDDANNYNQFAWQIASQMCNANSNNSIDWASLAQQWIQMKDSETSDDVPPPPVIGRISKPATSSSNHDFEEKGEADMEVEREEDLLLHPANRTATPGIFNTFQPNRWFAPTQTIGQFCPTQSAPWNAWPPRINIPPPTIPLSMEPAAVSSFPKTDFHNNPPIIAMNSFTHNVTEQLTLLNPRTPDNPPPVIDANKRKILPAWIREGLEKLEREKLKQLERERKQRLPLAEGSVEAECDVDNKIKSMVKSSLAEMEGENSGNEAIESTHVSQTHPASDDDNIGEGSETNLINDAQPEQIKGITGKTDEERLADMMVAMRKILTELLLEVTNEEISKIAHEEIRKSRAKASSAQVIRKSAIPSITANLGLGAYESDSEHSSSNDETPMGQSSAVEDDDDSEAELKANIRIRKSAFAKVIEEIEGNIPDSPARPDEMCQHKEESRIQEESQNTEINESSRLIASPQAHKTKGFDPEIGEPQPEKKSHSNGKRRNRSTRFSDNKDSRQISTGNRSPVHSGSSTSTRSLHKKDQMKFTSPDTSTRYNVTYSNSSNISNKIDDDKRSSSSSNSANKTSSKSGSSFSNPQRDSSRSSSYTSSSSGTRSSHSRRYKYSSAEERSRHSQRSSSYRSSRRRNSSESTDDERYKKRPARNQRHKGGSTPTYFRHDRRKSNSRSSRSGTRSRTSSRSRSPIYYSSKRRADHH